MGLITEVLDDSIQIMRFQLERRRLRALRIVINVPMTAIAAAFLAVMLSPIHCNASVPPVGESTIADETSLQSQFKSLIERVRRDIQLRAGDSIDQFLYLKLNSLQVIGDLEVFAEDFEGKKLVEQRAATEQEDWQIRAVLVRVLARSGGRRSAQVVADIIASPTNKKLRKFAASEFATMRSHDTSELIESTVENNAISPEIRARIMARLGTDGYGDVNFLKRIALGEIFPAPQKLSLDEGAGIMWNAIRALGSSKNPEATKVLIELQEAHLNNVVIVQALHQRGDRRAIPVLMKVLANIPKDPGITRATAATALGDLKATEAVNLLASVIRNEKHDSLLIGRCAEALGNIGDRGSRPLLENLLKNASADQRLSPYLEQERAGFGGPVAMIRHAVRKLSE